MADPTTETTTTPLLSQIDANRKYDFSDISKQTTILKFLPAEVTSGKVSLVVNNQLAFLATPSTAYISELSSLATDSWIKLQNASDVTNALTTALGNYYNKADADKKIAEAVAGVSLDGYETTADLATKLALYTSTEDLNTILADFDKSTDVDSKVKSVDDKLVDYETIAGVTTLIANYAKLTDLASQLQDYVKKTDFNTNMLAYEKVTDLKTTLADYAKSSDVSTQISDATATTNAYTDKKVADLVDSAPEALDTLKELADALQADTASITDILTKIGTKADTTMVYTKTEVDNKISPLATKEDVNTAVAGASVNWKWADDVTTQTRFDDAPILGNSKSGLYKEEVFGENETIDQFSPAGTSVIYQKINGGAWNMVQGTLNV